MVKQIITFENDKDANAWLSSRSHDKYETEIHFYGGGSQYSGYRWISIVYWEA